MLNYSQVDFNTVRAIVAIPPNLPGPVAPRTGFPQALWESTLAVVVCENVAILNEAAQCPVWILGPGAAILEEVNSIAQLG